MQTHEQYIRAVVDIVMTEANASKSLTAEELDALLAIKLVYGAGPEGVRGITYFDRFKPAGRDTAVPFIEISAFNQSSICQVTGTIIHELGHALAGWKAGHGPIWHEACDKLGLRKIKAAGTNYVWSMFRPGIRHPINRLELPNEGQVIRPLSFPFFGGSGAAAVTLKPCQAGIGTRGGKSRGVGSGSRLRKWQCGCGQIVRASTDTLDAIHNPCGSAFVCK